MASVEHIFFEVPELTRILKAVDPAALLVAPRVLRRVIRHDRHLGGIGLVVPHRKSYVIAREPLLRLVDRHELGIGPGEDIAAHVMLLERPDAERLAQSSIEQALVRYWRILFHARIDLAMEQKLAGGQLNSRTVREHIHIIGATEFDEIAGVMRQEDFLLPPETPQSIFAEFVAVYWTLRLFSRSLLPSFFPGLRDRADVDALVAAEVNGDAIFAATRPPGTPDPEALPPRVTQTDGLSNLPPEEFHNLPAPTVGHKTVRRLEARARAMDSRGNNVRAAILRTRSARGANLTLAGARAELAQLSLRLQKALTLATDETERWRKALLALLVRAARGTWSQEARFLFDLQKVCVDTEKGIFTVDVVEWAISLGRRPMRRALPGHQEVATVRHLRQALDRLRYVRLSNGDRIELTALVEQAVEHCERLMRERFRPVLANALDEVGLKPEDTPEELSRSKLIEELLDRVVDYGHLNFGNLRDAISRNQLKLPDLTNPRELLGGDPLLRLNRRLGNTLDGVYRRGEIYMRCLHRVSSVAFGTRLGRLLMLFLVLPFGLAFFTVVAPALLVEEGEKIGQMMGLIDKPAGGREPSADAADPGAFDEEGWPPVEASEDRQQPTNAKHRGLELPNPAVVALVGVFFLLLFHAPPFRRGIWQGLKYAGAGTRGVLVDIPAWLLQRPLLRAFLDSRLAGWFRRFLGRPLAFGSLAAIAAYFLDPDPDFVTMSVAAVAIFSTTILLAFTRLGRLLEETLTDWVMGIWHWGLLDIVPALIRFSLDAFRTVLEWVDQGLYVVDEWLRFRTGETFLLVIKAALGVVWFAFTYIVRIYVNLLIEPTVNPIKHFPVVTVGHKVMLPFLIVLYRFLRDLLYFLGPIFGNGLVVMTIFFLPGICGFVVWELKENWKLYRANRSRNLKKQMIGSHGETMLRLLKPGFHSGTIPKLFRKLRRAERRGQKRTVRKTLAALHHVGESVGHFVERELLALLRQSNGWDHLPLEIAAIRLTTNRVSICLGCSAWANAPQVLGFDHQAGWLIAGLSNTGWLSHLTPVQRQTVAAALTGFYKMAGVHFTREQLAAMLAPQKAIFAIKPGGLEVWLEPDYAQGGVYDWTAGCHAKPRPLEGAASPVGLPVLDMTRLDFAKAQLTWADWVMTWDRDKGAVNGERAEVAYAVLPNWKAI